MLGEGKLLDGRYEIIKPIGRGGMSTVYLCRNIRLGSLLALKEIDDCKAEGLDVKTEVNILKNLNHIGIPKVYDFFKEDGFTYIVEDYVEGTNLFDIVQKRGPFKGQELKDIAIKLCDILIYLHSVTPPIVYRDLKPLNIMLCGNGMVKLIDFGISRIYKKDKETDTVFMGSQGYIAPEQFNNVQSSEITDIYSFGVTLFFLTAGRDPVNQLEIMDGSAYPPETDKNILDVIRKAAERDPDKRYRTVQEMKRDIVSGISKTKVFENEPKVIHNPSKGKKLAIILGMLFILVAVAAAVIAYPKLLLPQKQQAVSTVSPKPSPSETLGPSAEPSVQPSVEPSVEPSPAPSEESEVKQLDTLIDGAAHRKKKGDWGKLELDPEAYATLYDGGFTFDINSIEIKKNNVNIYCSVSNNSGKDITIGGKLPLEMLDDSGKSVNGRIFNITGSTKILNGSTNKSITIMFSGLNNYSEFYEVRVKLQTAENSDIVKSFKLRININ